MKDLWRTVGTGASGGQLALGQVADSWHWGKSFAGFFCLPPSIILRVQLTHLFLCAFQTGGQKGEAWEPSKGVALS